MADLGTVYKLATFHCGHQLGNTHLQVGHAQGVKTARNFVEFVEYADVASYRPDFARRNSFSGAAKKRNFQTQELVPWMW